VKKLLLITACAMLLPGAAFAQNTGPAGQQDTNKPGVAKPETSGMNSGTVGGAGMTKDSMSGNGTSNAMNKGAESKDGDGMAKGGMKK
jgi:hypothetical protein